MDWRDYERSLGDALSVFAAESFPDDTDVEWRPLGYEHLDRHSYVEAEAIPPTVGYPRFKFVIERPEDVEDTSDPPTVVGCYVWEKDRWSLLFGTDPGDLHPGMTPTPSAEPTSAGSGCTSALLLLAPTGAGLLWLLSKL